jgi:hypothetical protein
VENLARLVGVYSLYSNTTGSGNIALGYGALQNNSTGNSNIGIGSDAGFYLTTGNGNIDIGNYGVAGESGAIRIGSAGSQFATYIAGISGVKTGLAGSAVVVDANGQLGTISSSRRYKEDIQPMGDASARLLQLRPVSFRYKEPSADGTKPVQFGLIAEEVAEVFPELVVYNKAGQPESVAYHLLPGLLLNELQKEHQIVTVQSRELDDLKTQVAQIPELKQQLSELAALKAQVAQLRYLGAQPAAVAAESGGEARAVPMASSLAPRADDWR